MIVMVMKLQFLGDLGSLLRFVSLEVLSLCLCDSCVTRSSRPLP